MKKPEIFKPNMDFKDNNEKSYYSAFNEARSNEDPETFINNLKEDGYIFGKRVVIVTKDKTYHTKIASKMGNRIITIDNDSIDIKDIENIYRQ